MPGAETQTLCYSLTAASGQGKWACRFRPARLQGAPFAWPYTLKRKSHDLQNTRPGRILVPPYFVIREFFFTFFGLVCHAMGKLFAMHPSASRGGLGRFPVLRNTHRRGAMAAATRVCSILKLSVPVCLSWVPDAGLGSYLHCSLITAGIHVVETIIAPIIQ